MRASFEKLHPLGGRGKFTGKVVKPINDEYNIEKLKNFNKGGIVWIFNDSDFKSFSLLSMEMKV